MFSAEVVKMERRMSVQSRRDSTRIEHKGDMWFSLSRSVCLLLCLYIIYNI